MKGFSFTRQPGMTLVEVMVALLVLGIGAMGYAALQLRSVRMAEDTYARSQAMAIAQDVVERIRANVDALPLYLSADWDAALAQPAVSCVFTASVPDTGCTSQSMAANDIYEVRQTAQAMLSTGAVAVAPCNQLACVTVAWNETLPASCDPAEVESSDRGSNAHCVVVEFMP